MRRRLPRCPHTGCLPLGLQYPRKASPLTRWRPQTTGSAEAANSHRCSGTMQYGASLDLIGSICSSSKRRSKIDVSASPVSWQVLPMPPAHAPSMTKSLSLTTRRRHHSSAVKQSPSILTVACDRCFIRGYSTLGSIRTLDIMGCSQPTSTGIARKNDDCRGGTRLRIPDP